MFHSFAISPYQCATKDSAERSTYTFLVARPAHNLLIALPASPRTILFQFHQKIASQLVHLFYIYIHIFILNISEHVCLLSIPACPHKVKRAIHQHIYSFLAGAHFADYITCLAYKYFVLIFTDYYIFASLLIIYF